jgi:hypothetical protein
MRYQSLFYKWIKSFVFLSLRTYDFVLYFFLDLINSITFYLMYDTWLIDLAVNAAMPSWLERLWVSLV